MSFQEKSAWLMLATLSLVYGWYFVTIGGQLGDTSVAEIGYQGVMLVTVVALVILAIIGHTVIAAIAPDEADKSDERDREITRFGEYVGGYVLGVGTLAALALAMAEQQHFWIANTLLLSLVLSEITALLTRVVAYRRGFRT